jgi:WD40 repeat protein
MVHLASAAADTVSVPLRNYVPFTVDGYNIAYSRDANQRVDGCSDSMLRVYDIKTGVMLKQIPFAARNMSFITRSYSIDSLGFILIRCDSTLFQVNIGKGIVSQLGIPKPSVTNPMFFSSDFRKLVCYNPADGSHMLWDLAAGTGKKCFVGMQKSIESAVFTMDEKGILALNSADSSAELRDAETDSVLMSYHFERGPAIDCFAEPGNRDVSVSA